uniref:hypothetical protein n=1 Tax=Klebsiella pneumoniae TaxID=573 RepID=UPI0013A5A807
RLTLIVMNEDEAKQDQSKQSVTVRLTPGQVRLIDTLAKNLEHSRQALLLELITNGINHVAMAYADSCGDKAQEVYRELMELTSYREGDL